jgi:uncharacterized repeat protein (TIGR03803 family)
MKITKILKSLRTRAALMLPTVVLAVGVATRVTSAQTYTVLYSFGGAHGATPIGVLSQGRDGNLYSTTWKGGLYHKGVAFMITTGGKVHVLASFDGGVDDEYPFSGLTLGTGGNFYGGTFGQFGQKHLGSILKVTRSGTLTTLHSFTLSERGRPWGPPIQGADGNFYGITWYASAYKITPSGTFTSLGVMPGASAAPLVMGTDGNFYGTTGADSSASTVFKMTPKGVVTILYNFDSTHGLDLEAPVIQGSDGNFYGTTESGGSYNGGVAFKLTPQGEITVLHEFGDPNYPNDGLQPRAGLVQATDGNFYGVTSSGGSSGLCQTCGVFFQITPAGAYSILYDFDGPHGENPISTPMQHTDGKIYGLAPNEGAHCCGVVYRIDMGLAPFVSLVSNLGKVGKTIEILGQGFTGTTAVSFNGSAATFTIVSATYLKATVPSGATTGFVTVTTPSGMLTSNKEFQVKP